MNNNLKININYDMESGVLLINNKLIGKYSNRQVAKEIQGYIDGCIAKMQIENTIKIALR